MDHRTPLDRVLGTLLGRLSGDVLERRNVFWMTVAYVLYGGASAFYGGELWLGFLTRSGFSLTQIGVLSAAGTFGGAFGLLAFMGLADRIQQRIRVYAICILVSALPPVLTIALALVPRAALPLGLMLGVLAVLSFLGALNGALWIMLDYPIMVRTISAGIRGRMFAILTTAYGLLAVVLGVLSAQCLRVLAFPTVYILFFAVAAGLALLRAGAYSRQRELPGLSIPGASRSALPFSSIVRVLKLREFQMLAGPHVVRGLTSGLAGLALPAALAHLTLPESTPGYATAANQIACILGGVGLAFIADRWGAGRSTFFGDALLAVALGTVLLADRMGGALLPHLRGCLQGIGLDAGADTVTLGAFLAVYFLLHFGRNIEDSAVPFGTTLLVPPEHMGAFSAARLMVLQGSSAVGSLLFGFCLSNSDPLVVFGLGALMKLLNGVWFWVVFRPVSPQKG